MNEDAQPTPESLGNIPDVNALDLEPFVPPDELQTFRKLMRDGASYEELKKFTESEE